MNRRLGTIILVAVLSLAVIGGLLFWAYKKQNPGNSAANSSQVKKVSDEQMIAPVASFDNTGIWFFNDKGQLFTVKTDGTGLAEFPLPSLNGGSLINALWPKMGSDFIVLSTNNSEDVKSYFNSTAKTYINFPSNVQNIDWLADGKRVVYIWKSSDNAHQSLVIANADGTGFHTVADVFWSDLKVLPSPDSKKILMYRTKINGEINKIYVADVATGAISTVIDQGKNISTVWLNADKFIYAQSSNTTYPKLYLYDFTTKVSTDLNLSTNINKILVDSDAKYLYASVPKKDNSADTFIKMDLSNFKQDTYFDPQSPVRGVNLMLLGNTLYFINTTDGKLYSIEK